jgi:hypothetical protein
MQNANAELYCLFFIRASTLCHGMHTLIRLFRILLQALRNININLGDLHKDPRPPGSEDKDPGRGR